jgi:hypothetical protein
MTMQTLRVVETRRETAEVKVAFPIFRRRVIDHPGTPGATVVVSERWDASGELWSVKHVHSWDGRRDAWKVSREVVPLDLPHPHKEADFALGRGKHFLMPDDFNRSLASARAFMAGVPAL